MSYRLPAASRLWAVFYAPPFRVGGVTVSLPMETSMRRGLMNFATILLAVSTVVPLAVAAPGSIPGGSALKFRFVGPPTPSRADAIAGVPGKPDTAYLGAASGGLWKTTDGGVHWHAVFDRAPVQAIGAVAVSPSDHSNIWVGTGEAFYIRAATAPGDGVWMSRDGGSTWHHMGLPDTGRIARIVVDPTNAAVVYVCATGTGFTPSGARGVFRTTNGGKTWKRVLFVNRKTGCSDLAIDPHDPQTLFAGMWQLSIRPWRLDSGGPGGGVFVTRDGGSHWRKLHRGLPSGTVGKVAVAVARSRPSTVYALVAEKGSPGLYRSDDSGRKWHLVSRNHKMLDRPPYYTRLAVDPRDPDTIYFASVHFVVSHDGGRTVHVMGSSELGDTHDLWINPAHPGTLWVAFDEGVTVTRDGGKHWYDSVQPPTAQMYHVSTDDAVPYHVMGNRQDGIAYYGPSDSLHGGDIAPGDWLAVGGGGTESGYTIPVPGTPYVWANGTDGHLIRFNVKTRRSRNVSVWPLIETGLTEGEAKERWNWTFPLAVAPWSGHPVFVGSQYVYESRDGGASWNRISPDLTRNDEAHEKSSGGVVKDNSGTFWNASLSSIAPSPLKTGLLWVGSYDGTVHVSRDGGRHWNDVTPPYVARHGGRITEITPSPFAPGAAYVALDRHFFGDTRPYIFYTRDYGKHWRRIGKGIPAGRFSYVHTVAVDPSRRGLLFAGTENGLFFSADNGAHWETLQENLPHAPVYWLTVQPQFHDLVVATFGRGIWILDDIRPLETRGRRLLSVPGRPDLLSPRTAWRFRERSGSPGRAVPEGAIFGRNPPYGAILDYRLPGKVHGPVELTIRAPGGRVLRRFSAAGPHPALSTHAGLNRFVWNLRYPPLERVRLRVPPPGAPWVGTSGKGGRPIVTMDLPHPPRGPLVAPGTYTVTLRADGAVSRRKLVVKKDPGTKGNAADIRRQNRLALQVYGDANADIRAINGIEHLLESVRQRQERSGATAAGSRARALLGRIRARLRLLERPLFDIDLTGAREDFMQHPPGLYAQLARLLQTVSDHDGDDAPTAQERRAATVLHRRLAAAVASYGFFLSRTLPSLNAALQRSGITPLSAPGRSGDQTAATQRGRT